MASDDRRRKAILNSADVEPDSAVNEHRRSLSRAEALHMRAGRAHEDPVAMTSDATLTRLAKHIAAALKKNPDLTPLQAANAGRLLLKDEMTQLARKSAAARAART